MQKFAIGSYTTAQGHAPDAAGKGLSIIALDESVQPVQIREQDVYNDLENPAYLAFDQSRDLLYATCETGSTPGRVDVFSYGDKAGLKHLGGSGGSDSDACHLGLSIESSGLFTAAYGTGEVTAFSLDNYGLAHTAGSIRYNGKGPNRDRQESPHAHQVVASPHTNHIYVCDLGTDSIWMHSNNPQLLSQEAGQTRCALKLPGGYGPRHLAFDTEIPVVYILCELVPRILAARINKEDGSLDIIQEISSTSEEKGSSPPLAPAAIKIHPSGQTLALSNRFRDTVAVFSITRGRDSVELAFSGEYPCGGKTPRDIEFNKEGSLLLIANQDSHEITSLFFDDKTGLCTGKPGPSMKTGSPVCIVKV